MLSHSIIVAPPPPPAANMFPTGHSVFTHAKQYKTQEDLDYHLKLYNFKVNDIVCFASSRVTDALGKWQLHVVLAVHDKIDGMVWRASNGMPMTLLLAQVHLTGAATCPWIRWDDAPTYRHITKEEYANLVESEYDLTQYLCNERREQGKKQYPSYFAE